MTAQEKLKAILDHVPILDKHYTSEYISMMVITSYLNDLEKSGLLVSSHSITPLGKNVVAVCEEFDWKPSDQDIELFLDEMVEPDQHQAFRHFIKKYRDNREELLEKIRRFKKGQNG
jgi:hypothetical protein